MRLLTPTHANQELRGPEAFFRGAAKGCGNGYR